MYKYKYYYICTYKFCTYKYENRRCDKINYRNVFK